MAHRRARLQRARRRSPERRPRCGHEPVEPPPVFARCASDRLPDASSELPTQSAPEVPSQRADVLARGVFDVLRARCGECHGTDLTWAAAEGIIVAESSAESPLITQIMHGAASAAANGQQNTWGPPTPGEVALVARYIDRLPTAPAPDCDPLPFRGFVDVYRALASDVLAAAPE